VQAPVTIIDHGLCNLNSISRALGECDGQVTITDDPKVVADASRLVLPGVGAFAATISVLKKKGLDQAILEAVSKYDIPVLGICLGMHLLADSSTEGGPERGLGLIPGCVIRLVSDTNERIPHMGWNEVEDTGVSPLFANISPNTDFYFVHSYHLDCPDAVAAGRTDYCGGFVSAAHHQSIMAVQFHPEKSQKPGLQLLRNFLAS